MREIEQVSLTRFDLPHQLSMWPSTGYPMYFDKVGNLEN